MDKRDLIMTSIRNLPREILLHIFSYNMETETQLDLIHKISYVCQEWENVYIDSSLWHTFDGSLPLSFLNELCIQGSLKKTELFKFSKCKRSLSKEELQSIYRNLPRLKSINFSKVKCSLSRKKFFEELIDHCPDLCEIILRDKCSKHPPRTDYKSLDDLLKNRGSKLVSLDLSNTSMSCLTEIFVTIASSCPNLEELRARNMCNVKKGYFPIVCMQKGLKKLKVLELGKAVPVKIGPAESTDGFPNLETFTYQTRKDPSLKKLRFKKLLMKSPYLRVLDVRGCTRVSHLILCSLPAQNLEQLYVSNTKVYERDGFIQVLKKWGHSLIVLDVSGMKENCINSLFSSLISLGYLQNLETLYLNNTAVTISTVKLIIQNCSKLNFLDLESCRAIGREYKRIYHGEIEILELLNLDID